MNLTLVQYVLEKLGASQDARFPHKPQQAPRFALRLCVGGIPVVSQPLLQPFLEQAALRGEIQPSQFEVEVFRHVLLDFHYAAVVAVLEEVVDEDGGGLRSVVAGEDLEEIRVHLARGVHHVENAPLQRQRLVSPVDIVEGVQEVDAHGGKRDVDVE